MTDVITETLERESLDIAEDRIAKLREDFPEVFRDGKIDFDTLRRALGEHVEPENERFGLQWPGKAAAFQAVQTPSVATLLPDPDNSVDWDTTQNLIIEGDNLEVLKLLQKSYYGKVKVIYIDPPYNTGNDFIYPDNYREGLQSYLEFTGQVNAEGKKLTTNPESGGRYHSNWLNMMYPRLYLAKNLLREDGVIFMSIDDNEVDNLLKLGHEVFGEDNFIALFTWVKKKKGSHLSPTIRSMTEYVVCFARNKALVSLVGEAAYSNKWQPLAKRTNAHKTLQFPGGIITTTLPDGIYPAKKYGKGTSALDFLNELQVDSGKIMSDFSVNGPFVWTQSKLDSELQAGSQVSLSKQFGFNALKHDQDSRVKRPSTLIDKSVSVGTNEDGYQESIDLFGEEGVLDYPKPVTLLKYLVRTATWFDEDPIVLDFFAGSGTTADAVMQLNGEDEASRRVILVQLPEPIDPPKMLNDGTTFSTIADITRERVRRAGKKIAADNPNVDTGFRSYKLATSNFTPWDGTPPDAKQGKLPIPETAQKIARQLEAFTENVVSNRTQEDLLTEILLRLGYDLTVPVERLAISGHTVFAIDNGAILACLESSLTLDLFEEMAQRDPGQIVCLDSAFGDDDELKVNAVQVIRSRARSEEATIKLWLV